MFYVVLQAVRTLSAVLSAVNEAQKLLDILAEYGLLDDAEL